MAMKTQRQDLVLGLVAIALLGLFLATVLFLAQRVGGVRRPIVVHFRHEDGLSPLKAGSQVLLSGAIEVGVVKEVEVRELEVGPAGAPRRQTVVIARAEIDESLPLYGDCEITTDMPLIGGSGTMVIVNVGTPGVPLPADHLWGQPPQGLAAFAALSRRLTAEGGIIDRLDRMLDPDADGSLLNKVMLSLMDINAITGELRTQLTAAERESLLRKVHLIMDDLNATTAAIRQQTDAAHAGALLARFNAVLDVAHGSLAEVLGMLEEGRPLVQETLVSVEHAARVIDQEMVANVRGELDPTDPGSLLSELHTAMARVNGSLAEIQALSATGNRMLVLSRPQIERVLANLREVSEELTLASKDIRLNPSKLLWPPKDREASKLDVFAAARDFAQAATYLDEAAARLQAVMDVAPEGEMRATADPEVRAILDSLQGAFERFERAEAFFWEQMK
jgi:hypothetical protein